MNWRNTVLFAFVVALLVLVGLAQSWSVSLTILNLCLISAIMSLGLNAQWGYAGLFNFGTMGFVALGGVAAVIVGMPPVEAAWAAGGLQVTAALLLGAGTVAGAIFLWRWMAPGHRRWFALIAILIAGGFLFRFVLDPAVAAIERVNPAAAGYLGGLGLPILISWPIGGLLAAGAAWIVGKTVLRLRTEYLAIATFGIAEIIIIVIKNEDWLTRGVKNVIGLPRPVAYEVDLQKSEAFVGWASRLGVDPVDLSSAYVKLSYAVLFIAVLLILLWLSQKALHSPWGRMMRAIRDNELSRCSQHPQGFHAAGTVFGHLDPASCARRLGRGDRIQGVVLALGSSAGWVRPGHLEHGDTRECQVPGDAGSVGTGGFHSYTKQLAMRAEPAKHRPVAGSGGGERFGTKHRRRRGSRRRRCAGPGGCRRHR